MLNVTHKFEATPVDLGMFEVAFLEEPEASFQTVKKVPASDADDARTRVLRECRDAIIVRLEAV